MPFEKAMKRVDCLPKHKYERKEPEYYIKVHEYYDKHCNGIKVNADRPIDKVSKDIIKIIKNL